LENGSITHRKHPILFTNMKAVVIRFTSRKFNLMRYFTIFTTFTSSRRTDTQVRRTQDEVEASYISYILNGEYGEYGELL